MIFYFSGTGNSAWAARQLARLTGDATCDIVSLTKLPDLQKAEQIGIVFPVHAWGAPEPVLSFVKKLPAISAFTFGVCTCGGDAGMSLKRLSSIYPLDSCYSIIMPNNYIVGTDTEDTGSILAKLDSARRELRQIAQEILQRQKVYRVREGSMAALKSSIVNLGFRRFACSASPFYATDVCNGCGLCARNCPVSAITLHEGMPSWEKQCCQCMRCINACPQQAIQYGKTTAGRRRYMIGPYLPPEEQ